MTDLDGYARAGADDGERYARFARESIDDQLAVIRSIPQTPEPAPPPVAPGSMWGAAPVTSADAVHWAATIDAGLAANVVKNAYSLGIPVPEDILERATRDEDGLG
jgi:hypothetical protein